SLDEAGEPCAYKAINDVVVVGLSDVGGLVGRADEGELVVNGYEEAKIELTPMQIIGVTNVGGVVGYADGVNVFGIDMRINTGEKRGIMGNLNVGGIVGYSTYAQISTSNVSGKLYGTVFDYGFDVYNEDIKEDLLTAIYYMPLNIGGVAGYAAGESTFETVTTSVEVLTDEQYFIDEDNKCVVKMTTNYLPIIDGIAEKEPPKELTTGKKFIEYLLNYYTKSDKAPKPVDYEDVDGGIGGFAGRLDNAIFTKSDENNYSDCVVYGDVYAVYGINVGGIVGYFNSAEDNRAIALARLPARSDEAINVAGKLFVGGYIGKTNGFTSATGKGFFDLNAPGYVNVQRRSGDAISGNCIGGVIGYSTGQVDNIKIEYNAVTNREAKIKIFNVSNEKVESMYIGVLVGRLDANMNGCLVDDEFCDAEYGSGGYYYMYGNLGHIVKGIIQEPKTYNYGGLVGLASVPVGSTGAKNFQITGTHYYPFTVNIVENKDYIHGQSSYLYSPDENLLSANAHYINMSNIVISVSGLTGLYNGTTYKGMTSHNPTNTNAKGWAKEYTMFRLMARVIEQPDEPTGDSVQVVYSADYITEVKTTYTTVGGKKVSDEIIYNMCP
ncbi:MAG: hypothetical protein J6Q15_00935, partial [Clostridia bacterium]|nr:hypothetical protein [Clostridia bacterium]